MIDPKVVPLRANDRCVVCGQPCEARCPEHAYSQSKMPLLERWRIGLLLLSGAACIASGGILVFILYKGTPDVDHATFSGVWQRGLTGLPTGSRGRGYTPSVGNRPEFHTLGAMKVSA